MKPGHSMACALQNAKHSTWSLAALPPQRHARQQGHPLSALIAAAQPVQLAASPAALQPPPPLQLAPASLCLQHRDPSGDARKFLINTTAESCSGRLAAKTPQTCQDPSDMPSLMARYLALGHPVVVP